MSPQTCETTDKFRIHMFEEGTTELLGKKDILATLHPGSPEAESASLGTQQRKTLGVLSSLASRQQAGQGEPGLNRGGDTRLQRSPGVSLDFTALVNVNDVNGTTQQLIFKWF